MSESKQEGRRRFLEIKEAVSHLKTKESKVALHMLAMYVDGALEQWRRVNDDEQTAVDESAYSSISEGHGDEVGKEEHTQCHWVAKNQELMDLHFYFVCADKISELIDVIMKKEQSKELDEFWSRWWRDAFEQVRTARNSLEHPTNYLREGWNEAYFEMFFDMDYLTIRDEKFILSKVGAPNMAKFFDELIPLLVSLEHPSAVNREKSENA